MKKTVTINLGGTVFSIDEDAFDLLKSYLDKVESHFSDEGERLDIMADIEFRIAELLTEGNTPRVKPVTLRDISNVIGVMGDPGDIGDIPGDIPGDSEPDSEQSDYTTSRSSRRIYRDVDNRVLGGVCSGMAAYWDIDVVIVRLAFVVLTLLGFAGVLIYIILWLVVPGAVSTAQKLEMRGEPVNISSIRDAVKEEFSNVRKNLKI